jgi:hypothetical protein
VEVGRGPLFFIIIIHWHISIEPPSSICICAGAKTRRPYRKISAEQLLLLLTVGSSNRQQQQQQYRARVKGISSFCCFNVSLLFRC